MKKMLALLLAAMMLLTIVPALADGPVEITMLLEGNNVTDDAAVLEKLNAYQRRLVHNFLATIPGIATQSEETDSRFKRITISRTDAE